MVVNMARRKTAAEIDEQLKARVKKLEAQAREATKAEQAAQDKAVLDAVRRWWKVRNETTSADKRTEWKDVPALFDEWSKKRKEKQATESKPTE